MPDIVCAIRGGPASQPTIQRAINLAKSTQKSIHFLYVVNLDFLDRTASSRTHIISKELRQMGEFILLTAQVQAQEQGIKADGNIREGNVGKEIILFCQETKAEFLILGTPGGEKEHDTFTQERMKQFARTIEEGSGAKVIIVDDQVQ